MAMYIYGTRSTTKLAGYFGPESTCPHCGKTYPKAYLKIGKYFHIDYIPLIPLKGNYFRMCPICGIGTELKSKEGKAEIAQLGPANAPKLSYYSRHILKDKPKGLLKADNSYEFWVRDEATGEETCISAKLSKSDLKDRKKARGIKNLPVYEVND